MPSSMANQAHASSYRRVLAKGLRRLASSDPHVAWVRSAQEVRVAWLRSTKGWERLARSAARWWTPARVRKYLEGPTTGPIAADGASAVAALVGRGEIAAEALLVRARSIRERDFSISGRPLPHEGPWPWNTDWRYGYSWPRRDFREYDHYAPRDQPYDVRAVWELTRLWFLQPVLQAAVLDRADTWCRAVCDILEDFEAANPVGRTINWHPMEVAMRAVSLSLLLGMARSLPVPPYQLVGTLLRMLTLHGAFLYRTVEYGNIRHNHFMANAAALATAGATLHAGYPPALRWLRYGARHLDREIPEQMLSDGVNFEKSTSYHRVVTELVMVAHIALERAGSPFSPICMDRVERAARFLADTTRTDGLSVNFGDNDGARVLAFDTSEQRDHRALVALAASRFGDPGAKAVADSRRPPPLLATAWLLGAEGLAAWDSLPSTSHNVAKLYPEGGVVTIRHGQVSLVMDVGEVGLRGRGGHGHNDLLSYELCLHGRPLVVDPGSPVYTGDLDRLDLYRSTRYHNGLQVDGQEIAPMTGLWRIADTARPEAVALARDGLALVVRASHTGYLRLPDPVRHTREVRVERDLFECTDRVECGSAHCVERFLHLAPGVATEPRDRCVRLRAGTVTWVLTYDEGTECRVEEGLVSPSFGEEVPAPILVLSTCISGAATLQCRIVPEPVS